MSAGLSVTKRSNDNQDLAAFVRWNRKELENLPEPDTEWKVSMVDCDFIRRKVQKLRSVQAVEKVGVDDDNHANRPINIYRTTEPAWMWLGHYRKMARRDRILPCTDPECPGNSFENPVDVEGIVCKDCNEVHEPDSI